MQGELVHKEDSHAARGRSQDGVDDGQANHISISGVGDGSLGASVESEEAEDEDETPETSQGYGVARHVYRFSFWGKSASAGFDEIAADDGTVSSKKLENSV